MMTMIFWRVILLCTLLISASRSQLSFGSSRRRVTLLGQPEITFTHTTDDGKGNRVATTSKLTLNSVSFICETSDGLSGNCESDASECGVLYSDSPQIFAKPCFRGNGPSGVCCPYDPNLPKKRLDSHGVLRPPQPPKVDIPYLNYQQTKLIIDNGVKEFYRKQTEADRIVDKTKYTVHAGGASSSHHRLLASTDGIQDLGEIAEKDIEASAALVHDLKLSEQQGTFALLGISANDTESAKNCPPVSKCISGDKYRTFDGSCNNLENPDWGKTGTAYQRVLPPDYEDGINSPRAFGINGSKLPSARLVSSRFINNKDKPFNDISLMLMQWGQFLDHDLTHTPLVQGKNKTDVKCCGDGKHLDVELRHTDCFEIDIPKDDPFFSAHGQECMDFSRSLPAPRRGGCGFGPREQMNQINSYIDASNVYGSVDARAKLLREGTGGRLASQVKSPTHRELLPADPNGCKDQKKERSCFNAGDVRANEQIDLAVIHTVWLREHNRVAESLQSLNPTWSDEVVYQEARRIIGAQMQHITYNEFLPLVLGKTFMKTYHLNPASEGHTDSYSKKVDASITNVFATAAYRFGHSLIQGLIQSTNGEGSIQKSFDISETSFKPFPVYDELDGLVRGLATQRCQTFDNSFSNSVTQHLFQDKLPFGMDLGALNIQRGRDHGLPPYNDWREECGLERINDWDELLPIMSKTEVDTLKGLYDSVDDIDLFVGGLGERPLDDAIIGPVFQCLVGDQFARLRRGDRFYYEEKSANFSEQQVNEIRKITLARVLCDNTDEITEIQPLVMQMESSLNGRISCSSDHIPRIDLSSWKVGTVERESKQVPENLNNRSGLGWNNGWTKT